MRGPILLTGARGYLGGCVLRSARSRGLDVRALEGRLEDIRPGSLDPAAVIHCAGARRNRLPHCDRSNRAGTESLLAGLRFPCPFVLVSSRAVYAPTEGPTVDETSPLGSEEAYGRSKLAAERLVANSGLPFVIFRPTALWGWGVDHAGDSFPSMALRAFLEGRPVVLHTPDRPVDHLHVGSFAELLLDALVPGPHWGLALNAASNPRSLHGLIHALGRRVESAGQLVVIREDPGPPPPGPLVTWASTRALFPGWNQYQDDEVLEEMVRAAWKPASA